MAFERSPTTGAASMRRWKLANLPTYLSIAQVQKALDGCDQATAMGRRDYAILMMLTKLGLRANEVATLAPDDIDWQSGEMLVRAKGRRRAQMPMPPDGGAAVVSYLVMAARRRRVAGCFYACWHPKSALHPVARLR